LTQDIVTRAAGILRGFNSYAGDRLRAGQVIATLEAPDLQSQAAAAVADAAAQASSARAAEIEAHHHAPNGVVIANAETSAMEQDLAAARSDQTAKREQARYWQNEVRREASLLGEGAVSQQEYQDERAQAASAQAAYDTSTQRIAALQQQLLASRTKAMDAVASVSQMQAQASAARDQATRARANALTQTTLAGYLTVTVPSDGTVIKRLIDPGVYVAAGTPIARIAVIDRLRVQANVAQNDLPGIREGTPIDATLPDGSVVHGRVTSVSPVADPTTHTSPVEAIVRNSRTDVVPGGFVRVTIHARAPRRSASAGVLVPSAAIVGSGDAAAVWMSVNNVAQRVPVRVLADNGTFATVSGALPPGSRVVVEGAATLQDGQRLAGQS
jgi:RND family efflux transporter MFP subunit